MEDLQATAMSASLTFSAPVAAAGAGHPQQHSQRPANVQSAPLQRRRALLASVAAIAAAAAAPRPSHAAFPGGCCGLRMSTSLVLVNLHAENRGGGAPHAWRTAEEDASCLPTPCARPLPACSLSTIPCSLPCFPAMPRCIRAGIESVDLPSVDVPAEVAALKARNQAVLDEAEATFQNSGALVPPLLFFL